MLWNWCTNYFSPGIKDFANKKLKCQSLFWEEKRFKEAFETEGINVMCKKKKMLFWRSLEEDFIYACVFEEGWKYV